MAGWALKIRIGRITITPRREHPAFWFWRSLTLPKEYGLGIWITFDPEVRAAERGKR